MAKTIFRFKKDEMVCLDDQLFKECFFQVRKLGSSTYTVYEYENVTSEKEDDEFHFIAVKNISVQEGIDYLEKVKLIEKELENMKILNSYSHPGIIKCLGFVKENIYLEGRGEMIEYHILMEKGDTSLDKYLYQL